MSDDVRRTILDATDKASAHVSFKKTSVEDIARAAGTDAADQPAEQATFDLLVRGLLRSPPHRSAARGRSDHNNNLVNKHQERQIACSRPLFPQRR